MSQFRLWNVSQSGERLSNDSNALAPKLVTSKQSRREVAITAIFGAALGTWLIGLQNVAPTSLDWLKKDAVFNQIAFEYFWNSPFFQFPLSATPNLGVGWGTGLHSNGENLFVALLVKPVAWLFDQGFQFQEIWLVLCFSLQAAAANRVFAELRLGLLARSLGTMIVTVSPYLVHRITSMYHFQMAAHWLILVSFLMYLRRSRAILWCLLLSFTLMTNVYLFVMVFGVWLASLTDRTQVSMRLKSPAILRAASVEVLCVALATVIVLAVAGHLTYLSGGSIKGPELLRASPITFFNPSDSNIFFEVRQRLSLPGRTWGSEDSEGFAYLGFGVIALMPYLVVQTVRLRGALLARVWPLAAILLALFLAALSNKVALGGREYVIDVPNVMIDARKVFRSAARFVWPLAYAVSIAAWTALARWADSTPKAGRNLVLFVVLAVQMVDVLPFLSAQQRLMRSEVSIQSDMTSGTWKSLLSRYDSIKIVPTLDFYENHADSTTEVQAWAESSQLGSVVQFSAENNLKLKFAYVSRPVSQIVEQENDALQAQLDKKDLASGSIYLFATEELWKRFAPEHGSRAFVVDGYFVILGPPR